jgi:hypothetical protein
MSTTKLTLIDFLQSIDRTAPIERVMTLVGAGDTALALLDLKAPTEHLDFIGSKMDIAELGRICATINSKFQVHTWTDDTIFGDQLPGDYLKSSIPANVPLARIDLRILNPLDIVITKIERLSEPDMRDIRLCIKNFKLGKGQISKRARALQQVGDQIRFERNLESVLGLFS